MPELNTKLCTNCGLCMAACHGGGIRLIDGKITIVQTENCDFCCVCEAVCPHNAISCYFTICCIKS